MNYKTGGNVFMKQEPIRKLLSLIIAVCMLFGMLPTLVFAVDGTITGTMDIGGQTGIDLGSSIDKLGSSGWDWNAATATLTLDSSYSGANKISINCGSTDTVNLVYSGDISIDAPYAAILCYGNLNISGTGGALTLTSGSGPLYAVGDLQITGGTVTTTTTEYYSRGIMSERGNITISGAATVTASGTGTGDGFGIVAQSGDLTISTTGTVTATGNQYAIAAVTTTVNSGTVELNGSRPKPEGSNTFILNGGTVIYNNNTPPQITGISPNSSPAPGGASVTITGSGFVSGVTVKIGGIAATDVTVTGSTQITCTIPSGSAGNATVLMETSGGAAALTDGFTYTPGVSSFFDAGTATFDLANLPIGNANGGSGDTAWTWSSSDQLLTLTGAGPYTLTGTASGNMRLKADTAVTLTLNGAHFTRNDNYFAFYLQRGGTLKVTADSSLTSTDSNAIGSEGSLAIELENNAVLQANATGEYSPNAISAIYGLTLTGSGSVEAESNQYIAVSCVGNLAVGAGCTLTASGTSGIQFQNAFSGDAPVISGGGKITAAGNTYYGISGNSATSSLTFNFNGNLEITGATYGIDMMKDDAPTAVIFANAPGSLIINSGDGIIGSSRGGTVALQNNANIPGLTEAFHAGGTTFHAAASTTFTVILNANGGTGLTPGTLTTGADGKLASLPVPTRSSYSFNGWYTAASGGTPVTTATVFTGNATIYAQWTYTGGDNGSIPSSGGSATPATPASTTLAATPGQPVTAIASVTATAGANSTASANIPEQAVTDAIAKAQADANAQGKTANGISVAVNVTMPQGTTSLTATLTRNSLNSLVSAGVTDIEINGSPVTVTLDQKALAEIQKQSSGNINITIAPNTSLSAPAKAMIGTRPVYNITVDYARDNTNNTVSDFGGGIATVSIPYTPARGEAVGSLYAVYVDGNGNATRIPGSAYDADTGCVIFTTAHFSLYGIGYTSPSAKFSDISTHWGKESIDYVVGRGLISGNAETTFAPNAAMTRQMLVTALGRLAGVDVKAYTTTSFTDVTLSSAFQPYIEWAYKKGVIKGIGNSLFAPDRAITREEIAVIFANYAKATGYTLPVTREATAYADADRIGSSYQTAVTAMQQAGVMTGGTGNRFNPKSSATRAEVSSMLHRYIKLTIDPATAQGWVLNDAGQYIYYTDGKALTGTQTIGGVKYFFNTDGTLKTGWVKDDTGNWYFYDRNVRLTGWRDIGENGSSTRYYFTGDGIMVVGKWLEIDGKWYYFYANGALAIKTAIDGYEVDENGMRKNK
jgi:uncharacterized repeat protein (TIGR02543 family)